MYVAMIKDSRLKYLLLLCDILLLRSKIDYNIEMLFLVAIFSL